MGEHGQGDVPVPALLTAAVLGVLFAQVALGTHDLTHRQVLRLRRPSEVAGRIPGTCASV
jgi:hypothetical protein